MMAPRTFVFINADDAAPARMAAKVSADFSGKWKDLGGRVVYQPLGGMPTEYSAMPHFCRTVTRENAYFHSAKATHPHLDNSATEASNPPCLVFGAHSPWHRIWCTTSQQAKTTAVS